jgi:hypothetical protein
LNVVLTNPSPDIQTDYKTPSVVKFFRLAVNVIVSHILPEALWLPVLLSVGLLYSHLPSLSSWKLCVPLLCVSWPDSRTQVFALCLLPHFDGVHTSGSS